MSGGRDGLDFDLPPTDLTFVLPPGRYLLMRVAITVLKEVAMGDLDRSCAQ
jgi:hypothetical protein